MPQPKRFTDEELRDHKNARSRQRYRENKPKAAARAAEWYRRKKAQDPNFLIKNAERVKARRRLDPERTRAMLRASKARHAEKRRAEVRAWFSVNKDRRAEYEQNRRAKKRANGGRISYGLKKKLYLSQQGACVSCRICLGISMMHMDHIMPLSLGGKHTDDNIQLLCAPCNQKKYNKHPSVFMRQAAVELGVDVPPPPAEGA